MKRILFMALVFSLLCCGCDPRALPVSQSRNEVERIELFCSSESDSLLKDMTILLTLTDDDACLFWDELQEVEVEKHFFSPPSYYGKLVVLIHYKDGSSDTLGTGICDNDYYYLNYEDTWELFSKYVDEKRLPYRTGDGFA